MYGYALCCMFIRWGERVFVHNCTSVVWWLFLVGPVLVAVDGRSVDSVGERMFVFVTFPLVVGHFWAVENYDSIRHLIDTEAIGCSVQVFCDIRHVSKFPGKWVDTARELGQTRDVDKNVDRN